MVDVVNGKRNEVGDGIKDVQEMSMMNELASGENEIQIFLACLAYDIMCPRYFESKNIGNYIRVP